MAWQRKRKRTSPKILPSQNAKWMLRPLDSCCSFIIHLGGDNRKKPMFSKMPLKYRSSWELCSLEDSTVCELPFQNSSQTASCVRRAGWAELGNQLDYSEEQKASAWKGLFPSGAAGWHPHLTNLIKSVSQCAIQTMNWGAYNVAIIKYAYNEWWGWTLNYHQTLQ